MKNFLYFGLSISMLISLAFTGSSNQDPWVAPSEAKELNNPNNASKKSIKNGQVIYAQSCALCHGETGKGDGIGAQALNPKPADHTSEQVQGQTDGELFWKISNGRGQMVGWGMGANPIISESDRWDLVNYIRTLKGK